MASTMASPSPAPPASAAASRVGAVEALEHPLQLLRRRSRGRRRDDEADAAVRPGLHLEPDEAVGRGGVLDGVADEVAQRLGEAVGIGGQLGTSGIGPSSKWRSSPMLAPHHSSLTNGSRSISSALEEVAALGAGEQQHVVDQPGRPGDLRRDQPLDPAHLLGVRVLLGRQHLQLAGDDRQRRAQLMRGVGDELALGGERLGQPVEHVVEGLGEHVDLAAAEARRAASAGRGRRRRPGRRPAPSGAAGRDSDAPAR